MKTHENQSSPLPVFVPASTINNWLEQHEVRAVRDALVEMGIWARSETECRRKVRAMERGTAG